VSVRPKLKMACELIEKTDRTIWAMAEMKSVDPDIAVGHHPIEYDVMTPMRILFRQGEGFTVPSDAVGEVTAALSGWIGLSDRARNAPVMGNAEDAPLAVIEAGPLGIAGIAL